MPDGGYLRRYRVTLGLFIAGLIVSGLTAFPLAAELHAVCGALGLVDAQSPMAQTALGHWLLLVRTGLDDVYARWPWVAYGTDWLAFAHVVLAVFFFGPWKDPVRNVWVLQAGLIACVLVIPLALICGPVRGIPLGWRLIDCSFGVFGAVPLLYCLHLTRRLERSAGQGVG